MTSSDLSQRLPKFLAWFQQLEAADQEELMNLVYSEFKVREVVRSFASMPTDQRKVVFERLGLPNDMLNRIPPPTSQGVGEVEVEWKEWDANKAA